jgi:hypothetical protein
MSSTDSSSPPPATDPSSVDLDEVLRNWPEVARPAGGFEGLGDRITARALDGSAQVDESVDVLARPALDTTEEPGSKPNGGASVPQFDTLAALARDSAAPKREAKKAADAGDDKSSSGVINFKALIAQGAAEDAAGARALEDAVKLTAAPELAVTQPSTVIPAPARAGAAAPAPAPRRSSAATWALVVVIGLAAVVAYSKLGSRSAAPERRARVTEHEESWHEPAAAAENSVAQAPAAAATAPAGAQAGADPAAASTNGEAQEHHATEPGRHGAAASSTRTHAGRPEGEAAAAPEATAVNSAPAPTTPAPTTPAPTKRATADLDALISGSLGSATGPAPGQPTAAPAQPAAPAQDALPQPNRQQITRAMGRVSGAVRACANGQTGMAMMRVTFVSDGSVSNVTTSGGPFAGTPAAACMENAVRSARVPAFTNPNVSINYPFVIQPPDPGAGAPPQ